MLGISPNCDVSAEQREAPHLIAPGVGPGLTSLESMISFLSLAKTLLFDLRYISTHTTSEARVKSRVQEHVLG